MTEKLLKATLNPNKPTPQQQNRKINCKTLNHNFEIYHIESSHKSYLTLQNTNANLVFYKARKSFNNEAGRVLKEY